MPKKPERVIVSYMRGSQVVAQHAGWKDFYNDVENVARRRAVEYIKAHPEVTWDELKKEVVYP